MEITGFFRVTLVVIGSRELLINLNFYHCAKISVGQRRRTMRDSKLLWDSHLDVKSHEKYLN